MCLRENRVLPRERIEREAERDTRREKETNRDAMTCNYLKKPFALLRENVNKPWGKSCFTTTSWSDYGTGNII